MVQIAFGKKTKQKKNEETPQAKFKSTKPISINQSEIDYKNNEPFILKNLNVQ
jgi:ABC-type transport system involved in cytochrome bd biosynthesis fused ATPase/permease subunit